LRYGEDTLVAHVALVGPSHPFRGGIAHHTTMLARTLASRHDLTLYSFRRLYPRWLFPGRTDRDTSERPLLFPGARRRLSFDDPASWLATGLEIRRGGFDVLLVPWWIPIWAPHVLGLLATARRRGRPRVVFLCHNVLPHETGRLDTRVARLVLRRGDAFVVHAAEEERRLRELLGGERRVLRAFLPPMLPPDLMEGGRLPPELRAPRRGERVLLFFGFVRGYKGLDVLLEAMPEVLRTERVVLWIVGEMWGDQRAALRAPLRALGDRVSVVDRYVGNDEMGAVFAEADLVVQPYRSATGSGIAPVALDRGVPIVATRVGSLPEVVEDGVSGRLVSPGDAGALALAIREALRPETLAALRDGAAERRRRFGWVRLGEELGDFLRDVQREAS
jgi:glycosyltransferase involved in cell wall biosynthesis